MTFLTIPYLQLQDSVFCILNALTYTCIVSLFSRFERSADGRWSVSLEAWVVEFAAFGCWPTAPPAQATSGGGKCARMAHRRRLGPPTSNQGDPRAASQSHGELCQQAISDNITGLII